MNDEQLGLWPFAWSVSVSDGNFIQTSCAANRAVVGLLLSRQDRVHKAKEECIDCMYIQYIHIYININIYIYICIHIFIYLFI